MSGHDLPRELFDDAVLMLGGGIDYVSDDGKPTLRIQRRPPRLDFGQGTNTVAITLVDGELRSTARTDEDHALVARMSTLIRESIEQARVYKAKRVAEFERDPLHESATFGRAQVDALVATAGTFVWTDVALGDANARISPGGWDTAARITLTRGTQKVEISLLDDTLRTTAATDADRAFVDELGTRVQTALEELAREREARIAAVVATAPAIDRDTLVEALTALTHGRVDVEPIADAIMLSTTDPRRYVAENRRSCFDFGIEEPVEGLHVVALLTHIPDAHLAYFDWKDSMEYMLPVLAEVLGAGPGVILDVERYRKRCDAWDRSRERIPALKELAREISGAALVELKTPGDAYAIACVPPDTLPRLRAWSTKAHVPLRSLVEKSRAAKAVEKALAQATDVKKYAASARFAVGDIVEHPTFGRGQVVKLVDTKVVIRFADSERTLVHAKT